MADESKTGILGHLPPLPRPALNNSVIGMEQAYRQRKGLQPLTEADIEALKAGQPMPWEVGGAPAPASAPAAVATPAAPPPSSAPATPAAAAGTISEEVAKWVAQGNKWSKSTIAAEQARRGRKGLPALNNAEMSALLGEPVEASAPVAAPAAPTPAAAAPVATPAAPPRPVNVVSTTAKPSPPRGKAPIVGASLPPLVVADAQQTDSAKPAARDEDSLIARTMGIRDHVIAVTQRAVSVIGGIPSWIGSIGDRIGGEDLNPRPPANFVSAS